MKSSSPARAIPSATHAKRSSRQTSAADERTIRRTCAFMVLPRDNCQGPFEQKATEGTESPAALPRFTGLAVLPIPRLSQRLPLYLGQLANPARGQREQFAQFVLIECRL